MKKKAERIDSNSFMTNQLRKAIMHRSRLKNVFKKTRTPKTWQKMQFLCKFSKENTKRVFGKCQC